MLRQLTATFALTAIGALSGDAAAQCIVPDGLSGPCWQPATANLPTFPTITLPGTGICWDNCDPQPQVCTTMAISTPLQLACGRFSANLNVADCFGNGLLGGDLVMDYTRTWQEVTPPGPTGLTRELQVWRFLVKIDMRRLSTAGGPACVLPSCYAQYNTAFYYGYLDYARDCDSGSIESAVALYHACDGFIHDPAISSRPGVFHPNLSYALVGPSSAVNPFVAGFLPPPVGPLVAEATRGVPQAAGGLCITEDRLAGGQLNFAGAGCGCPFSPNPQQLTARRLDGVGTCTDPVVGNSVFKSLKVFPGLPWFHVMTTSLGAWGTDATYPGKEIAWVDECAILFRDSCSALAGGPNSFAEIYYGASTSEGYDVIPVPGTILTKNFMDIASNTSFPLPGPIAFPLVGAVAPTRNLIYLNLP